MKPRLSLVLALLLAACAKKTTAPPPPSSPDAAPAARLIVREGPSMGTDVSLTLWTDRPEAAAQADLDAVFAEFARIDALMTTWTETSDIARINAAAGSGAGVIVTDEVVGLVQKSLEASMFTGGAFDITVGVFQGIWKFDQNKDGTLPDAATVAKARALVDWHDVIVDAAGHSVRLRRAGQKITLGGIAKGYAVDRGVAILRARGYHDFMVQAGGDLFVAGKHGDRRWRVGIRDPRGDRKDHFAFAEVEDRTFSTSGDYERFVINAKEGKRYHHILDPKTGAPAPRCRSVTVMAGDAVTAEGLTKGIFILGPEQGLAMISHMPGIEAVIVAADNQVFASPGIKPGLKIVHPPTDGI